MAGILGRLSQRLLFWHSSQLASQAAANLAPSSEVLVNSMSTENTDAPCSNIIAVPSEPSGAMPCSIDVATCTSSSPAVNSVSVSEADDSLCSRRHRRNHRRARRHRLCRVRCKDVNFVSAMCSVIVVVLICTSLYEPHWWYVGERHCRDFQEAAVSYLGVRLFFYEGFFVSDGQQQNVYYYGTSQRDVLKTCVTPHIVYVVKSIVILCFVVIIFNIAAILLDVVTFMSRAAKALRNYAVFSILSVCTCVTINILSYMVTQQLVNYYEVNTVQRSDVTEKVDVDVEFSLCFYIILASGVMSVIAVASNLLCRRGCTTACGATASRPSRRRREDRLLYPVLFPGDTGYPELPPPPPYEP